MTTDRTTTSPADEPSLRGVLLGFPALEWLDPELIAQVEARCTRVAFEPGDSLTRQGDEGDCVYFLVEGSVIAEVVDPSGSRKLVGRFGPRDVVGEMAFVTGQPRLADVVAAEAGVALSLGAEDLWELGEASPLLQVALCHVAAERLGEDAADGLRGKRIERYLVRRCVGRGAMAMVYEAQDEITGQTVALKMMSHRLVYEPAARSRFQREADLLLPLTHPNLTRVLRRFSAYRTAFIVLEYCDGGDLSGWLARETPVGNDTLRSVVGQLAAGLAALHAAGILHRDLKPRNILLTSGGALKLADFGLAGPRRPPSPGDARTTVAGEFFGTPAYMAPELFQGGHATVATDLYALGRVVLELALGQVTLPSDSLVGILDHHQGFELPSRQHLADGALDPELYGFLAASLATDPAERQVDLQELARWAAPVRLAGP